MGLSIRDYAARRGVSHTRVKKAIDSEQLTLELDGTIDAARAYISWTLIHERCVHHRSTGLYRR